MPDFAMASDGLFFRAICMASSSVSGLERSMFRVCSTGWGSFFFWAVAGMAQAKVSTAARHSRAGRIMNGSFRESACRALRRSAAFSRFRRASRAPVSGWRDISRLLFRCLTATLALNRDQLYQLVRLVGHRLFLLDGTFRGIGDRAQTVYRNLH